MYNVNLYMYSWSLILSSQAQTLQQLLLLMLLPCPILTQVRQLTSGHVCSFLLCMHSDIFILCLHGLSYSITLGAHAQRGLLCVSVCLSVTALAAAAFVSACNQGHYFWIEARGFSKKPSVQKLWREKA